MEQESVENYLRIIYCLYEKEKDKTKGIKSISIAKELRISKPSVSEMVKKLVKKGFVRANPYSRVFFTNKGMKKAKTIMHNYRVIEVFLKNVLDYNTNKLHEEAHRLEHAFSEESITRLDKFLNNAKIFSHGDITPRYDKIS